MNISARILAVLFFMLLFLAPEKPQAAEEPARGYEEITWEQLLPGVIGGKALSADDAAGEKNPESYPAQKGAAAANPAIQGKNIKIYGFVVPLERNDDSSLAEFLLVPYFGACIHVPPPPQNQIIHVIPARPVVGIETMDTVFVYGVIKTDAASSASAGAAYSLEAVKVEKDASFSLFTTVQAGILTLLCGMSVSLGWVGPFAAIRLPRATASLGVAFAAGIMACIGVSTVVTSASVQNLCLFLLGAALIALGEFLLHSGKRAGAEGKAHVGAGPALAVALHNLPECVLVFSSAMVNSGIGFVLGAAMIAHNIPLGIALGVSSNEGLRPNTARMYAALAGCVPPVAAIAGCFFMKTWFSAETIRVLFVCSGGALFFIALAELVPFARQYGGRLRVLAGFSTGAAFLLSILFFSYQG